LVFFISSLIELKMLGRSSIRAIHQVAPSYRRAATSSRLVTSLSDRSYHSERDAISAKDVSEKSAYVLKLRGGIDKDDVYGERPISFGVFNEQEGLDIDSLVNNYTVPALARALREREVTLQRASVMMEEGDLQKLKDLLHPFQPRNVLRRRHRDHKLDLSGGFHRNALVLLQRYLHRMPREVFHSSIKRASVVIPLCNVHGVASVLFQRRSVMVKTHKQQVCFPGGMVDEGVDASIIQTSLREMEEELGIASEQTEVLGILRCKWSEVAGMTGVAVTPVIGYIGELSELQLHPNYDEVEQVFSIPLKDLLDESNWTHKSFSTPAFHGGPFVIWGLTAYLLHRFLDDVVRKCSTDLITSAEKNAEAGLGHGSK